MNTKKLILFSGYFLFLLLYGVGSSVYGAGRQQIFTVGAVSLDPKKHYERYKSIADYLSGHLKDLGIMEGKVYFSKNHNELMQALRDGRVDYVTQTPLYALRYQKETGAQIILRRWKEGVPEHSVLVIVKKDSNITQLSQLKGKTIAFESADSVSGYLMPLALLREEGFLFSKLSTPVNKAPYPRVGYIFSGGPMNTVTHVYRGLADAGVLTDLEWESNSVRGLNVKNQFNVLDQFPSFDSAVELVRSDLNPEIKKRVKDILLHPPDPVEARQAFQKYEDTTRFDPIKVYMQHRLNDVQKLMGYLRVDELKP